jgi:hypothetical protein
MVCCWGCGSGSASRVPLAGDAVDANASSDAGESPGASVDATSGDDSAETFEPNDGGVSVACRPGDYVGSYTGVNDSSKVGGPKDFPISGPMQIALVQSATQHGEFLDVTNDATFDAVWGGIETADAANGLIVIQSTLAGQLDCGSGVFSAMSTSADWTLLTIPAGMATVNFTGMYDAASATIAGQFTIVSSLATSTGTWTVTLTPGGDP